MPAADIATVKDDDRDFYGREYWFSHQEQDLGFTNITLRARTDLSERGLHWLRVLLKYKLPPGHSLELGAAHGGFVALMRWAGFEATGLELSPWVVDYAHRTFDVPMLLGKLEDQQLAASSLDVIALMDVLEHLLDPVGTMRRCLELLKPEGLLLIQTPRYVEGRSHDQLIAEGDPFVDQLKATQHLYLFSEGSVRELFRRVGANFVAFEPAIFAHYDMFLAVSREPVAPYTADAIATALSASPSGRLVLALLDLDDRYRDARSRTAALDAQLAASEADRAARLRVIERQGSELDRKGAEVAELRNRLTTASGLLGTNRARALSGLLRPGRWEAVRAALHESGTGGPTHYASSPNKQPGSYELDEFTTEVDRANRTQSNAALLDAIRAYNHSMIDALDRARSVRGKRVLDIGASPHGYALERALRLRVAEYIGVGLDVHQPVQVRAPHGLGRLVAMNAEQLDFADTTFDLVFSISTFEHVSDVPKVLAEIRRVLKPGGSALISFEPVWTCSYGHHLHHFGPVSRLMPDWAHLIWDKSRMVSELAPVWPADATPTLEEAAHWVYESGMLNRVPLARMREYFAACDLDIQWMTPMPDERRDTERLREISDLLALPEDDLMTKGLSVLLNKA